MLLGMRSLAAALQLEIYWVYTSYNKNQTVFSHIAKVNYLGTNQ